jgi:hypothetical protein
MMKFTPSSKFYSTGFLPSYSSSYFKFLFLKMCEKQWIISAGAKMGI